MGPAVRPHRTHTAHDTLVHTHEHAHPAGQPRRPARARPRSSRPGPHDHGHDHHHDHGTPGTTTRTASSTARSCARATACAPSRSASSCSARPRRCPGCDLRRIGVGGAARRPIHNIGDALTAIPLADCVPAALLPRREDRRTVRRARDLRLRLRRRSYETIERLLHPEHALPPWRARRRRRDRLRGNEIAARYVFAPAHASTAPRSSQTASMPAPTATSHSASSPALPSSPSASTPPIRSSASPSRSSSSRSPGTPGASSRPPSPANRHTSTNRAGLSQASQAASSLGWRSSGTSVTSTSVIRGPSTALTSNRAPGVVTLSPTRGARPSSPNTQPPTEW